MKKFKWEENLTRFIMICVGIICLFLSIYYSTLFYLNEFKKPLYIAISLASAIAAFNTFSLTACTFLIHTKKRFLAIGLAILAFTSIIFDITTVVGSQSSSYAIQEQLETEYNELKIDQNEQKSELKKNLETAKERFRDKEVELKEIRSSVKTLKIETSNKYSLYQAERRKPEEEKNKTIINSLWQDYNRSNTFLKEAEKEEIKISKELEKLKNERDNYQNEYNNFKKSSKEELKNEEVSSDVSFGAWLSSVLTFIPKKWIQFLLVLVPALFIDLISPIAMNFGFSLSLDKKTEFKLFIKNKGDTLNSIDEKSQEPELTKIEPEKESEIKENKSEIQLENTEQVQEEVKEIKVEKEEPKKVKRVRKPRKKVEPKKIETPIIEEPIIVEKKSPFLNPKEIQKPNKEENKEDLVNFKFGKTTPVIMNKLIDFISLCIDSEGMFDLHPDIAAQRLSLGEKAKKVFLDRLSALRLDSKPLIERNKYGEYTANFSANEIIKFVSEEKQND